MVVGGRSHGAVGSGHVMFGRVVGAHAPHICSLCGREKDTVLCVCLLGHIDQAHVIYFSWVAINRIPRNLQILWSYFSQSSILPSDSLGNISEYEMKMICTVISGYSDTL